MDSNEQLVSGDWRDIWQHPPLESMKQSGFKVLPTMSKISMIEAAADFTRAHLENLRCAEQDCFSIEEQIDSNVEIIRTMDSIDAPFAVCLGEDLARLGRTLGRLQAVRDDLKRGMK